VACEDESSKSDTDITNETNNQNQPEDNSDQNLKSTEAETEATELLDTTGDTLSCDDMSEEKSLPQEYFTENKL